MESDSISHAYRSGGSDRYRREGPSRSDSYYNRGSGPYDRPGSYRHHESRPRRIEDVIESDELIGFEQFARYTDQTGTSENDSEKSYQDYVKRHRKSYLERYFERHKHETWFIEKYDPFKTEAYFDSLKEAAKVRSIQFKEALQVGLLEEICLEDGEDLRVESDDANKRTRSYPASMNLPARLHGSIARKGNTLSLSNISPMVPFSELFSTLQGCSDNKLISLELSSPQSEKGNYRLGWATFDETVDLTPIVSSIEEKILYGEKIYCSAQKTFSYLIKIADEGFSTSLRITRDLELASNLMVSLDTLLGLESPSFDPSKTEKQRLDLILIYLKTVHFVDYYNVQAGLGINDLNRLAGDLTVRYNIVTSQESSLDTLEWFDRAILDLQEQLTASFPAVTEDAVLEKHISKVDEGRFRCVHCSKLFKGPEFVVKHLRLKHEDVAKTATLDTVMVNSFLAHPTLCALLPLPSRRKRSISSSDRPFRDKDSYRDRRYGRDFGGDRNRRPPPAPKDAVQDPRKLRQYVDWDAPATGDVEISYD